MPPILFLVLSFFVCEKTLARTRPDKIDDLVTKTMAEQHIPGAAVAIVKNGRAIKIGTYGFASLEFDVAATPNTVFEIGSVSKQMTAAAIMLLVEKGKVDLDAPISTYIPESPVSWSGVKIRHLLTHTSGIKSYTSLEGFELWRRMKRAEFVAKLAPYPLEFTPGEKNIYSNSAFNLLAYVIEAVSGQKYIDFMKTNIFVPLGMLHTTDRDPEFVIPNRAAGYEWNTDHFSGRDGSLTDLTGAGSIVSTIGDMVKWEAALHGNKFLSAKSRKEIWTPFTFNNGTLSPYGFGWRISNVRGHKLIGHTGQTAGFGSAIFRYADDDVTVIALTNIGTNGMGALVAATAAKAVIPGLSLNSIKEDPTGIRMLADIEKLIRSSYGEGQIPSILSKELADRSASERSVKERERLKKFAPVKALRCTSRKSEEMTIAFECVVETEKKFFLWNVVMRDGMITSYDLGEEEFR